MVGFETNDFDSREEGDLMVVEAKFDNRGHATFDELFICRLFYITIFLWMSCIFMDGL